MTTIRYSRWFDIDNRMQIEYFTGANCSGVGGAQNRVLTLSNTQLTTREQIFLDGLNFHSSLYTVSSLAVGTTITILRPVWNDQRIVVNYWLT